MNYKLYSLSILSFFFISTCYAQLPLSGTYTIGGTAPSYPTITAAVADLNAKGVSAKVTFNIRKGIYAERFQIKDIIGASAANTVTFQSESGKAEDVLITSAGGGTVSNCYTIQLRASKHIILNKLTVANTHPDYAIGIHLATEVNEVCEMDVVSNCIIELNATSTSVHLYGIATSDPEIQTTSAGTYTNNTFENNKINGGYYGIYNFIQSTLTTNTQTTIRNNVITGTYHCGIHLRYAIDFQVHQNTVIMRSVQAVRTAAYGIYSHQTGGGVIANNVVIADFTNTTEGWGIWMGGGLYSNPVRLYFNTVKILGDNSSSSAYNTELLIPSSLRNNIFCNYAGGYAVKSSSIASYTDANYNNLYSNGAYLSSVSSSENTDLAAHRASSDQDANSISVDPKFLDTDDYHLLDAALDGKGEAVVGITIDRENDTRAALPDIGADEFSIPSIDLALRGAVLNPSAGNPALKTVTIKLRNEGTSSLANKTASFSFSTDGGTTWSTPETYTIQGLETLLSVEYYTFTTTASFSQPGKHSFCVRINTPGITSDAENSNDSYCTDYCNPDIKSLFTIGSTGSDFTSLTEAISFFTDLTCGIGGPVVVNIQPGIYEEKVTIPPIKGTSPLSTLTFQSVTGDFNDVTIQDTASTDSIQSAIIVLNGSQYIRFNGITFKNASETDGAGILLSNGALENKIEYCRILLDSMESANQVTGVSIKSNSKNNTLTGNMIRGGSTGIEVLLSDNGGETHLVGNTIEKCRLKGIGIDGSSAAEVSGNRITFSGGNSNSTGIHLFSVTERFVVNANLVLNSKNGIVIENSMLSESGLISNNMISETAQASVSRQGIALTGSDRIHIIHNSVYIGSDGLQPSKGLRSTATSNLLLLNNLFYNAGGDYAYSIDEQININESNYNYLYSTGPFVADMEGDKNFSDLQSVGLETNSFTGGFTFWNAADLHNPAMGLNGKGLYDPSVPLDFDGQPRDTITPDIGADEFSFIPNGLSHTSSPGILLYPNPAKEELFVSFEGVRQTVLKITLFNLLGEVIHSEQKSLHTGTQTIGFNVAGIPAGMYMLQLDLNGTPVTTRVCITK